MAKQLTTIPPQERPSIQIRHFSLPEAKDIPRYWMDNNPATTHFLHALSCIFPGGERFFVKSVLAYQSDLTDPRLKREARQFCGQEAIHGQQHEAFNSWDSELNLRLAQMTRIAEEKILSRLSKLSKRHQLAMTVALEHITAIMGHALLMSPDLMQRMDPRIRPLWIWHAIEEIEHKAVAHEIFYSVGGQHRERYVALIYGALGLTDAWIRIMSRLMWRDGKLFDLKSYYHWIKLLHKTGFLRHVWLGFKDYFRHDFHPWQTDDRALLERFIPQVGPYVPQRSISATAVSG